MPNIFLIHGAYGNPDENWFPWLRNRILERERHEWKVIIPHFPTPQDQSLASWRKVFAKYEPLITTEDIFVGHSLGPAFILDLLQRINISVKAVFLIAPFVSSLGNPAFDSVNKTFYQNFDWKKIRGHSKLFKVYYSDNDPYVPAKRSREVAQRLGVKPILVKKAGHFNAAAGYTLFELLWKDIEKEMITR